MSKFGLEIRNQCYFTISNERFMQEIGIAEGFTRPREKDLIYFPLDKRCYQIFYVENKWPAFYGLGILPAFKLTCELFEASSERFTTGIPGIDRLNKTSQDMYGWSYTDVNGVPYTDQAGNVLLIDNYAVTTYDHTADNKELTKETDTFVSWSESKSMGGYRKMNLIPFRQFRQFIFENSACLTCALRYDRKVYKGEPGQAHINCGTSSNTRSERF